MRKKFALAAILTIALALPASGALARAGGGGGGHMGGGHMGGGHMGGGFGGGHMGGGMHMGGGHIGGGMAGGHIGGGLGGGSPMATPRISPQAGAAFGAARVAGIHGVHNGRFRHHRHFFVGGLGYGYSYTNPCWDWVSTPLGWQCYASYDY
jgi:hypothetical protein